MTHLSSLIAYLQGIEDSFGDPRISCLDFENSEIRPLGTEILTTNPYFEAMFGSHILDVGTKSKIAACEKFLAIYPK